MSYKYVVMSSKSLTLLSLSYTKHRPRPSPNASFVSLNSFTVPSPPQVNTPASSNAVMFDTPTYTMF